MPQAVATLRDPGNASAKERTRNVTSPIQVSRTSQDSKVGPIPHGQPMPTGKEVGSNLVANSGQNTGFYPLFRLITP